MFVISENSIINAAVRFLRNYYKTRNELAWEWKPLGDVQEDGGAFEEEQLEAAMREMETDLRTQVQKRIMSEEGVVVDAMLTFFQEDNLPFKVALEATSFHKKEEANFIPQRRLLTWDSIAISCLLCLLLYTAVYYFHGQLLHELGIWTILLLLWVLFFSLFFSIRWMLKPLSRRYRYIFAVEQFKQYFAHEQWIAIGADVFDHLSLQEQTSHQNKIIASADKRAWEELKRQCIQNGLGLIVVNEKLQTQLVFTPSRLDLRKEQRRQLTFLPNRDAYQKLLKTQLSRGQKAIASAASPLLQYLPDYERYRRKHYHQTGLTIMSLLMLTTLLLYEYQHPPIIYVDESRYKKQMEALADELTSESTYLFLDSNAIMPYLEIEDAYLDVNQARSASQATAAFDVIERSDHFELLLKTSPRRWVAYDCARLYYQQDLHFVSSGSYSSIQEAVAAIDRLRSWGIPASFYWEGCFSKSTTNYRIVIRYFFENKADADYLRRQLIRYQREQGILGVSFEVRTLG